MLETRRRKKLSLLLSSDEVCFNFLKVSSMPQNTRKKGDEEWMKNKLCEKCLQVIKNVMYVLVSSLGASQSDDTWQLIESVVFVSKNLLSWELGSKAESRDRTKNETLGPKPSTDPNHKVENVKASQNCFFFEHSSSTHQKTSPRLPANGCWGLVVNTSRHSSSFCVQRPKSFPKA